MIFVVTGLVARHDEVMASPSDAADPGVPAFQVAADLRLADMRERTFAGADVRDYLFLTQMQVESSHGDGVRGFLRP